jgi:hypothetical protein
MGLDARAVLTPQERLALSRRALIAQLNGQELPEERDERSAAFPVPQARHRGAERFAWGSVLRSVTQRWWRRHPANAVGQLARPLLDRYAREQPAKLVAAAAATGALVVLVKPWRLLSITALVAAVWKTSDVADLVTTLMQKNTSPRKDPP